MPPLIITRDAVSVRLRSETLEIVRHPEDGDGDREPLRVPLYDVERVIICGRPSVPLSVLHQLMKRGIPIVFLSWRGRYLGTLAQDAPANALRRIRQYEFFRDDAGRRAVASRLIYAKIRNARRVLQRLAAPRGEVRSPEQKDSLRKLRLLCAAVRREPGTLDEVNGIEGAAAAVYFRRLGAFFPPELPFSTRSRRPPLDAANALLSYGYAVAAGEIESVARAHGLDVGIGFLHSPGHDAPALVLDLLEPLRAPLCDMLALHLLNHRILRPEHFRPDPEDGGTYLADDAKPLFFTAYEQTMTRKFTPAGGGAHVDFRQVIERQVYAILRLLEGERDFGFFLLP
jgi:CRISPR-associated protein Cas1